MTDTQRAEQLKDRRDYRTALINRRNEIDTKIKTVEAQISRLNAKE